MIEAQCLKGCSNLGTGQNTHKWTLSEKTGSWTSGEQISGKVYKIGRNTLTPGSVYTLKCVPNGTPPFKIWITLDFNFILIVVENGAPAYLEIKTHKPGKIISCSINPKRGKAFSTLFVVNCEHTGSNYVWKIYSSVGNTGWNIVVFCQPTGIALCICSDHNITWNWSEIYEIHLGAKFKGEGGNDR